MKTRVFFVTLSLALLLWGGAGLGRTVGMGELAALQEAGTAGAPGALPDLIVIDMRSAQQTLNCPPVGAGVIVTIFNQGDAAAGEFATRLTSVGSETVVRPEGLAAGQSAELYFGDVMPLSIQRTAVADVDNHVAESNEGNNVLIKTFGIYTVPTCTTTPTPTPTPTPTRPAGALPDLTVQWMYIALETGGSCSYTSADMGTWASIANTGDADAGPFVVSVNGVERLVSAGLKAGASAGYWVHTYVYSGESVAIVDATHLVEESNEQNNELRGQPAIATPPPTCTPTRTPTPSVTPTPGGPLPDLIVLDLRSIQESIYGCQPEAGVIVTVFNQGDAAAGGFTTYLNSYGEQARRSLAGLAAGHSVDLYFYGAGIPINIEYTAIADVDNEVAESNEGNNEYKEMLYIYTQPTCTPTPTITTTPTPVPTLSLTPTVTGMPTFTPTCTWSPTRTKTPSPTSTPILTDTPTLTPTVTDTFTPTPTVAATPTPTPTGAPSATPTATALVNPIWLPLLVFQHTDCRTQPELPVAECEALPALYWSTGGPHWSDSSENQWNLTQYPCSWRGVDCSDGSPRHVTSIDRAGSNLTGELPDLSALTGLETVRLSSNHLGGSIPDLSSFGSLKTIDLANNRLSGTIPATFPPSLEYLYLASNQLEGTIPAGICAVSHLFDLDYNLLSGVGDHCVWARDPGWLLTQTVPPEQVSVRVVSPTESHLSWTPIYYRADGGYYEVRCSTKPGGPYASMGTTEKSGGKAAGGFDLAGMTPGTLYFCVVRTYTPRHGDQQNDLTSKDGAEVLALPNVMATDCRSQVDIPQAECEALLALYHSTDGPNWCDGPTNGWNLNQSPCSWTGVGCDGGSPQHVTSIDRSSCSLGGTLPNLSALTHLERLSLETNDLDGTIPDLSALTNLQVLRLNNNRLCGSIPELSALVNLQLVDLGANQLTGSIPDLSALANLQNLGLGSNRLSGNIPDLSNLGKLQALYLDGNELSGSIPTLSGLTNLQVLWLQQNRLTGSIPDLTSLTNLGWLWLNGNQLSGQIPPLATLANLGSLDLSHNWLGGPIPDLTVLANVQQVNLSSNQLDGPFPDLSPLVNLQALDLSHNHLDGSIPDLSGLGALLDLRLAYNRFEGHIPGVLPPKLAHLYLEGNQLEGPIPVSVCHVVSAVTLKYNKLTSIAWPCSTPSHESWVETQTVAPTNLHTHSVSSSSAQLLWTPIPYTGDGGHYEVRCGTTRGGPYSSRGTTADSGGKTAIGMTFSGLTPGDPLFCVVRTLTHAHGDQQNDLTSLDSDEVAVIPSFAGTDCSAQTDIPQAECEALVALYTHTFGVAWLDSPGNGWNVTQTPCQWAGVSCSSETPAHVVAIQRAAQALRGDLPDLSDLVMLRVLDLSDNQLTGGIPSSLPPSLEYLSLHHNRLVGAIPDLSAISGLQVLNLDDNHLSGIIPDLANLVSLRQAWLHNNQLSGSISQTPAPDALEELLVGNNQLSGDIPVWVCRLSTFGASYNKLSGFADPCLYPPRPGVLATQTLPPENLVAYFSSPANLEVNWLRILYVDDGGYYEVRCGTGSGGPYTVTGTTGGSGGKTAQRLTLSGLAPGTPYYCTARTFTPAHGEQQNDLTSLDSEEVYVGPYVAHTDCQTQTDLPQAECEALVALYQSTDGLNWSDSPDNTWNLTQTPCRWRGVTCTAGSPRHVAGIGLSSDHLKGVLPDLSALPGLTRLNLSSNELGGPVPDLSTLTALESLRLNDNQLTGGLPDVSKLTRLATLDVSSNHLSGEISHLASSSLVELRLNGNQLSGSIPDLSSFSRLATLDLYSNKLSGEMPAALPPRIDRLDLSFNELSGTLPDLSAAPTLTHLDIASNQIGGGIPAKLPPGLHYLDASSNRLSGGIPGVLPESLGHLYVANNQLSGQVPSSACMESSRAYLDLAFNRLTSAADPCVTERDPDWKATQTVPPTQVRAQAVPSTGILLHWQPIAYSGGGGHYDVLCGTQSGGPYTSMGTTAATGGKSADGLLLGGLSPTTTYYCVVHTFTPAHDNQRNDLTSTDSAEVNAYPNAQTDCRTQTDLPQGECEALLAFYQSTGGPRWSDNISNGWNVTQSPCSWTGIQCYGDGTRHVVGIDRPGMNLVGSIPNLSGLSGLSGLKLRNNQLGGSIPPLWPDSLRILDLSHNALSGKIPTGLPSGLIALSLEHNELSGAIPAILSTRLISLSLAANELSGSVPDLSGCTRLDTLDLRDNHLEGGIPANLPKSLRYLYLSANELEGTIPDLSALTGLRWLFLRDNHLAGAIPDLSTFTDLRSLDLSANQLSGSIPGVLPPALEHLEVANNQLSGQVPRSVCMGPAWQDAFVELGYNKLASAADPCVRTRDPDWAATQTVPPANVQAQTISATMVKLTWTRIQYTRDRGYYEVRCGAQSGGPYTSVGTTATTGGKTTSWLTVSDLAPGNTYYCVVRTFTPAHGDQQSDLTSIDSAEVTATTDHAAIGP